ncbi:MAG: HD-GYP domain-containing protein [Treponema sp.]|nr:HD-GYP domain-containing protein [Candidatus Treponema caballi]
MNTYSVTELKENTFFSDDVILDKQFLLVPQSVPVSEQLIKALEDWSFKEVLSEGALGINPALTASTAEVKEETPENHAPVTGSVLAENIRNVIENSENTDTEGDADAARISMVEKVFDEYMKYIAAVYTHYATHKEINYEEISEIVKEFCVFIKENRRFVLRVKPDMEARDRNFLVSHALRSTTTSIVIGMQLRLPLTKLVELGVSCILHEIGMIRLPPQLYMTDRPLTPNEKKAIFTHPLLSYDILKGLNFPLSICLGALEHHEKENGTGYPRHLVSEKISLYAKIISVACAFEAITAPRHYKEAQSPYEAMVEMLNKNRQFYDETVIKALLYCLSLFPIGCYVFLSDGKVAEVIDVNPDNPKNPIVQVVATGGQNGEPQVIQTSDTGIKIVRALSKAETDDVIKLNSAK